MPRAVNRWAWTSAIAGALTFVGLGCGAQSAGVASGHPGADGSIVYLDAASDRIVDGGFATDALPPVQCSLLRFAAPSSLGCRADWSCGAIAMLTFACGPSDGGEAACYCLTNNEIVGKLQTGACTTDARSFWTQAHRTCQWTQVLSAGDGGMP